MRIKKSRKFGRWTVKYDRRSKSEFWGRFGGGWNWKLGIQIGSNTIIVSLVIFSVSISRERKTKPQGS